MPTCPSCTSPVPENAAFCGSCGSSLGPNAPSLVSTAGSALGPPRQPWLHKPSRLIAAISVAVVLVLVVVGFRLATREAISRADAAKAYSSLIEAPNKALADFRLAANQYDTSPSDYRFDQLKAAANRFADADTNASRELISRSWPDDSKGAVKDLVKGNTRADRAARSIGAATTQAEISTLATALGNRASNSFDDAGAAADLVRLLLGLPVGATT
jgi:hypothetical protein